MVIHPALVSAYNTQGSVAPDTWEHQRRKGFLIPKCLLSPQLYHQRALISTLTEQST